MKLYWKKDVGVCRNKNIYGDFVIFSLGFRCLNSIKPFADLNLNCIHRIKKKELISYASLK